MQVASELIPVGLIVKVLWQCLNQGSYCIVAVCIEVVAEPLQLCAQLLIPVAPRPFPKVLKALLDEQDESGERRLPPKI